MASGLPIFVNIGRTSILQAPMPPIAVAATVQAVVAEEPQMRTLSARCKLPRHGSGTQHASFDVQQRSTETRVVHGGQIQRVSHAQKISAASQFIGPAGASIPWRTRPAGSSSRTPLPRGDRVGTRPLAASRDSGGNRASARHRSCRSGSLGGQLGKAPAGRGILTAAKPSR